MRDFFEKLYEKYVSYNKSIILDNESIEHLESYRKKTSDPIYRSKFIDNLKILFNGFYYRDMKDKTIEEIVKQAENWTEIDYRNMKEKEIK